MHGVVAVISCGIIEVALCCARTRITSTLREVAIIMNHYIPRGLQQQMNLVSGVNNLLPQSARNGLFPNLPAHLQMRQAPLSKAQLNLLQHQFIYNHAFTNSEQYHPEAQNVYSNNERQVCHSIKQEILKKLNVARQSRVGTGSATSHESRESSPDLASSNPATLAHIMQSRGTKRQLDLRQSPQKKRSRPGEEGGYHQEDVDIPPDYPNRNSEIDSITQVIWQQFDQNRQSQELYQRKMALRDALYTVMKGVFPYCGLYVVGSSMNGFGNESSDMDVCLMLSQTEVDQKRDATELLRIIYKALKRCSFLKELNLIRAKVPILKFQDTFSGVECDLNINNSVGIRNTHLLNSYCKMDWRLAPLVVFVKHWAKIHNINDASRSSISSYSLVLMALHYLQYGCDPPVLPSLQQKYPHKFNARMDIRLLTLNDKLPQYSSSNTQSLGELFIGFLNYYANVFNFEEHAISVRLGTRVPRKVVTNTRKQQNLGNQWKYICIEEPFDMSNTARSVYDQYVFQRIQRVIRMSFTTLRKTGDIHSILGHPF